MTTTPEDDFDPTPYIIPLDQGAPNPYEDPAFDGNQAVVTDETKVEGLGGTTYPESPLTVQQARTRLHDLVVANSTVQWDGKTPIKMMCLSVQHNASGIGSLHYDAQQDCDDNPDKTPCTYDTIDWSKVDDGAFVYFRVGAHGHICRKFTHAGKPIFCSSDVRPGMIGYVGDARWFQRWWGAELEATSRVCNNVWQKGIPGNDQQGGGGGGQGGSGKGVKWPGWAAATTKLLHARGAVVDAQAAITDAKNVVDALPQHWQKAEDIKAAMARALDANGALVPLLRSTWAKGHSVNNPPAKKKG